MTWQENLKQAGVSVHAIATGAGAGFIQKLWEVPGSSSYLSGFTFPYAQEEQIELLGFTPEHYCSEEAAVDLASAAYMKAYRFGGKKPVGIGLTASVASEHEHRGDHRVYCCIMTDDLVRTYHYNLIKGAGDLVRRFDGGSCDETMFHMLCDAVGLHYKILCMSAIDAQHIASERFWLRPFFHTNGQRDNGQLLGKQGLMAGAFNPPHEGHFGMAKSFRQQTGWDAVFEISTDPPHKAPLTVQDMLKRAKMLQGYERIFTKGIPMYLQKALHYPRTPLIMGADAALRLFDLQWGVDPKALMELLYTNNTPIYVADRMVDGKLVGDIELAKMVNQVIPGWDPFHSLKGRWDISSTELRNKAAK